MRKVGRPFRSSPFRRGFCLALLLSLPLTAQAEPAYREALSSRHVVKVATAPLAVRGPFGEALGRQSARLIARGIRG